MIAITASPLLFEHTDQHGAVGQDLRDKCGEADRISRRLGIQHGDVCPCARVRARISEDARDWGIDTRANSV